MNENLDNYGYTDRNQYKVEEWFDNHPDPSTIDVANFEYGNYLIQVFYSEYYHDCFMIKITFENAQRALTVSKELFPITLRMGIEQVLQNKKLFLLRTRFFEC